MLNPILTRGALAAVVLAAPAATFAQSVFFDLEDQSTATGLVALTLIDPAVTLTLNRGTDPFDIVDFSAASGTVDLGTRTIVPGQGTSPFTVSFSTPASSFSVNLGDFGDDDDTLTLTAYDGLNGLGNVVDTSTATLFAAGTLYTSIDLFANGSSINSVVFTGGDGDVSVTVDNIGLVVPEPASLAALAATSLLLRRRR